MRYRSGSVPVTSSPWKLNPCASLGMNYCAICKLRIKSCFAQYKTTETVLDGSPIHCETELGTSSSIHPWVTAVSLTTFMYVIMPSTWTSRISALMPESVPCCVYLLHHCSVSMPITGLHKTQHGTQSEGDRGVNGSHMLNRPHVLPHLHGCCVVAAIDGVYFQRLWPTSHDPQQ